MIVHQPVRQPVWRAFANQYGDYRPRDVVIVHHPGDHSPDYCIETKNRPDSDYVHNAIERAETWKHRVSAKDRRLEVRRARTKKLRRDRYGHTAQAVATDL